MNDPSEPRQDEIDAIADALDRDDARSALELALRALRDEAEPDALLHYFAGRALLDLERAEDAVGHLERAVRLDAEDPDYRSDLAIACLRACRFDVAREHVDAALGLDEGRADLHELDALLLEREGRFDDAERAFARAGRLDPEGFPPPVRLERGAFEAEIQAAAARLPETFRAHLDEVAVVVEDVPGIENLTGDGPPLDPAELLGLFHGATLADRSYLGPGGDLPPRILLFQRNLERYAADPEDLREQIAITLYHELGHYLGMDEDDLDRIDLA